VGAGVAAALWRTGRGKLPVVSVPESEMRRSSRDLERLRLSLERWLAGPSALGAPATVPTLTTTSSNGMSSETLLLEAAWTQDGRQQREPLVARVAPDPADVPVFPRYDLRKQFETMRLVADLTSVPVPRVRWYEGDEAVIGAPFFVMDRVEGQVPPDVMPYPFGDNWLFDAEPGDRRRLQDATVDLLAELHAIDGAAERFGFLEYDEPGDTWLRRHVAHRRSWYEYAAGAIGRSRVVERGFAWLDEHWPADDAPVVLSWGDSRIGNIMYRDFRPVAVLDWEMAGLGPRELDLGWLVYAHMTFDGLAATYGFPGMSDFLRADDVVARYEATSAVRVRDLQWFLAYSAVQWGIVGMITGARGVHFGERPKPDDVDELLINRPLIEQTIAG
jgi:aminoglycoside phosphotransferase (APT) family kinase protein